MKPVHLLILDVPTQLEGIEASGHPAGQWREELALADSGLANLLTAAPVSRHGALSEWELTPDGQQIRPAPRHRLMCPPIWERVSHATVVGIPWTSGSHPEGSVVTAEFASPRLGTHVAALPDRAYPPTLYRRLSEYRVSPAELDATVMLELGFPNHAHRDSIATLLSLHAMATGLIEHAPPQLAIVRLSLAGVTPNEPGRTGAFLAAVQKRYEDLSSGATTMTLIRVFHHDHVQSLLRSQAPDARADSGLALGTRIARQLGVLREYPVLPKEHWQGLRQRYQPPHSTMPGTMPPIKHIQRLVDEGLASLARHAEI